MERYEAYKDSGIEWIGEIPRHWDAVQLKRVMEIRESMVDPTAENHKNLPHVGPGNIETGGGAPHDVLTADEEGLFSGKYLFKKGDIVYGKINPHLAKVTMPEFDGLCSADAYAMVSCSDLLSTRYAYYSMRSRNFTIQTSLCSLRAGIPKVNRMELMNCSIALPPAIEQQAIADYLDVRTAEVDALVADCEREVELLREYRKAVISEAVTKGLDPDAPMKDSGIEWIGEIPDDWEAVRLDKVAIRKSGHTPDKKVSEYWDGNIVWISLADSPRLRANVYVNESTAMTTEAGIANSSAELLPEGAVLLSRDASVGLTAIAGVQLAVSQHFMAYICDANLSNEYLRYVFLAMHQEFEKLSMGSTIPTIGLPLMRKLSIPYPSRKKQDEIVGYLNARVNEVNALIVNNQTMADKLREYRRSLIAEAVTGKFKVPEVDR